MFEGLLDIKNDRRLSVYLYRMGFGFWLLYLALGAPALHTYHHYRPDAGVLCIVLMVVGFSASMVYEYFHNRPLYEQKKIWLAISHLVLAAAIYMIEFKGYSSQLHWTNLLRWLP